jgi:hypothetical protein
MHAATNDRRPQGAPVIRAPVLYITLRVPAVASR